MRQLLACAVALASLAAAAPASVSASSLCVHDGVLHYDAAARERNAGGISDDREYLRLVDSVPVMTGAGCEQVYNWHGDTDGQRCRAAGVASARVRLGDQNDWFSASSELPITLLGGRGDDHLGPASRGLADGGAGDDTILIHVGGSATLAGGPGEDTVVYGRDGFSRTVCASPSTVSPATDPRDQPRTRCRT